MNHQTTEIEFGNIMDNVMFSVVIPAYNCEATIRKSIQSVFGQSRIDLIREIIVVNDGSTDNTEKVVLEAKEEDAQGLIKYFGQENKGAAAARNMGIKLAEASWIALLDADDAWKKNKIERQYETICQNPEIVFLGCHYPMKFIFKKYTEGLHKITARQLCLRYMPTTPSVVFKKEAGMELGLYNETMRYCEDINFFQKFFLMDSYYILAEDLVDLHLGKAFVAEKGLSSNLIAMHKGRDKNTLDLYKMGLISLPYLLAMLFMNQLKVCRRIIQDRAARMLYKKRHD